MSIFLAELCDEQITKETYKGSWNAEKKQKYSSNLVEIIHNFNKLLIINIKIKDCLNAGVS